jgi:hypothetical protein
MPLLPLRCTAYLRKGPSILLFLYWFSLFFYFSLTPIFTFLLILALNCFCALLMCSLIFVSNVSYALFGSFTLGHALSCSSSSPVSPTFLALLTCLATWWRLLLTVDFRTILSSASSTTSLLPSSHSNMLSSFLSFMLEHCVPLFLPVAAVLLPSS